MDMQQVGRGYIFIYVCAHTGTLTHHTTPTRTYYIWAISEPLIVHGGGLRHRARPPAACCDKMKFPGNSGTGTLKLKIRVSE